MTALPAKTIAQELTALLGDASRVTAAPAVVERLSKDFYWYSPVLRPALREKRGDVVAQPVSADEVRHILRYCYQHDVPVTARGAGTGNYGQAIPLCGGVVLDLSRMDRIAEITGEGVAICEPGVRLGMLETAARERGWELRCYPSTIVKATVGGFLGGGSGGIGSVMHGGLRDFGTVGALEVVTMEEEPRLLVREGEAVHEILHAWGTNGIITKIWLALTPKVNWAQVAVSFGTFAGAFDFSELIARGSIWKKRLVTVFEWPIPQYFSPIKNLCPEGKHLVFFLIAAEQKEPFLRTAELANGDVTFTGDYLGLKTTPLLSDYTWNHTTLWAIKHNESYTYLQCGFDASRVREQMHLLKEQFGDEILFHMEFMKNGQGHVIPGAIPLVRFTTEARLNQMIRTCREHGVFVANPHVNNVEDGGRFREDHAQLRAKHLYDPKGLLNPGKMLSFEPKGVTVAEDWMKTWIPDSRKFAYLNWKQVEALRRPETLLVLPTAAIEQHGHHLPLATDTLINNLLLGKALEKLPAEAPVYALEPLCYGKSNEHLGFPGTLSLSASTFMAVVRDLGASIAAAGFRKLVLYNTHGGNASLVDVLARDLRADFGLRTFALYGSGGARLDDVSVQERAYGFHAGEVETAFLLNAVPQLVDTSAYTVNYIADIEKPVTLLPENAAATFAWLTRDVAASGVMGDPRPASAEHGARWMEQAAQCIAQALEAMFCWKDSA